MPRDKADGLREKLWAMPHDERCTMLVCSIIQRDPRSFDVSNNLLDLLMRLSVGLGEESRRKLSVHMRDAADHLENFEHLIGDEPHDALH